MKRITFFLLVLTLSFSSVFSQKFSEFGSDFTPMGDLRILVIFVTFQNESIANENPNDINWPADRPIPTWAEGDQFLFHDYSQFDTLDPNNKSISNYFYQMSEHRLRVVGDYLNVRITLPPTVPSGEWNGITQIVMDSVASKYRNQMPLIKQYFDNRGERPNFTRYQTSDPDGVVDFVVVNYRYYSNPNTDLYDNMENWHGNGGGFAGSIDCNLSENLQTRSNQGVTIVNGVNLSKNIIHEIGHAMFNAPHYGSCNGVVGNNLHATKMGGMMPSINNEVYGGANAWERWYLGWIDITNDLTYASGTNEYYLDDYFMTGETIRIKLPYSNQYLWLENHQGISPFENRIDWKTEPCDTSVIIPPIQRGLIAYIENTNDNKNSTSSNKNGFKLLHRRGNFDLYTIDCTQHGWGVLCNNPTPRFTITQPNVYSGYNESSNIYLDFDHNGEINYTSDIDEGAKDYYDFTLRYNPNNTNGYNIVHGNLGIRAPFQVGDSIGICTNPPITNIQTYHAGNIQNNQNQLLDPIYLSGVKIKILEQDSTGRMKIKISFDDYDFNQDVRMCGDVIFPADTINVNANITMDKSGTINRTVNDTLLGITDFINPSIIKTQNNSYLRINSNNNIVVKNRSTFVVEENSTLEIENNAKLIIDSSATLILKPNANLIIREGGEVIIKDNAFVCISNNANLNIYENGLIDISTNASAGVNDYAQFRNLGNDNCPNIENLTHLGCGQILVKTDTITNGHTEQWDTYRTITNDFVVKSADTLIIENTTIAVFKDKKIIVEPNAKLIVKNSTITNYKDCSNSYWQGILVEGNANLSQNETNQGVVELNNSVIENAHVAISTIDSNYNWDKTGGIIKANNTTFLNNNKSIEFLSYRNISSTNGSNDTLDNVSYFSNCSFVWDTNMLVPEGSYMNTHISMWQVQGVEFIGCTFDDKRISRPSIDQTTHGILAVESSYTIRNYSQQLQDTTGNILLLDIPTSFSHLTYGIRTSSAYSQPCNISRTQFTNNYCGIFATNSYAMNVTNSTFNLYPQVGYSGSWLDMQAIGVSLQLSKNFVISNNDFIGQSQSNKTAGIQIDNISFQSQSLSNTLPLTLSDQVINNNKFNNVFIGIQSLGKNFMQRSTSQFNNSLPSLAIYEGLVTKCNLFENTEYAIYITKQTNTNVNITSGGIKPIQGSTSNPVNNEFSNVTMSILNYDGVDINYWNYESNVLPPYSSNVTIKSTSNQGTACGIKGVTNDLGEIDTFIVNPPILTNLNSSNDCLLSENNDILTAVDNNEVTDVELWNNYIAQYKNSYNIPTNILLNLSTHETSIGLLAIEILYFKGIKTDYHPSIIFNNSTNNSYMAKAKKISTNNTENNIEDNPKIDNYNISISPNPAINEINVVYNLEEYGVYSLVIYNIKGEKEISILLEGNNGKQTISLTNLLAGSYYYCLYNNGTLLKINKLVVTK
jgi:hypothetical protein